MHIIDTVYSAFTTSESILRNDPPSMWNLSHSYNDGSSHVSRAADLLQPSHYDFSRLSEFSGPSEARVSTIEFASPSP